MLQFNFADCDVSPSHQLSQLSQLSRLSKLSRFSFRSILAVALLTTLMLGGTKSVCGQGTTNDVDPATAVAFTPEFSAADESVWEFGLKLSCDGGYARNVAGVAPIPMPWPEQEVVLFEETKSNNVQRINVRKLGSGAKIMSFKVLQLGDGGRVEAVLRFRVKRKNSILPDETEQFKFATKVPSRLKKYLKPSPFIDSRSQVIKQIGQDILQATETDLPWDQVEAIYNWVRENVQYKFDTQLHSCEEALESGHGDCEELSSLFIAICRSRGIPARAVWVPGHTYPEFYLEDETGVGHWFPCQIAGAAHEFGSMAEDRPILQKGDSFRIPNISGKKRYVEASAGANDASGTLSIEQWVMQKVETESP